jgi:hypothetical protein
MTINPQELLDYHLGQMEDDRRLLFESRLAADPAAAERSTRVASTLGLLLNDGPPPEPPPGLLSQTAQFVRDTARGRASRDWVPLRLPVRWADAAVAAAMLLAGLGTLVPALLRTKMQALTVACAGNLHQVGVGLASYAMAHGHYPQPPEALPVGAFGLQLHESGLVEDPKVLTCPANTVKPRVKLPPISEFFELRQSNPQSCDDIVNDGYAYQMGFRAGRDKAEPLPARLAASRPLLADCPPLDDAGKIVEGNSRAHGGGGQNVLFSDNHVEWRTDRRFLPMDKDIYRNANNQTGLGLHPGDVSLLPAVHRIGLE